MIATTDTGAMDLTVKVGDTFELLGNDAHPLTVSKATTVGFVVDCPQCGWCEVSGSRLADLIRDGWLARTDGPAAGVVPSRVLRPSCLGKACKAYRALGGRSCA